MVLFAGVDAGSVTAKAIIVEDGQIRAYHMTPAGSNYRVAAQNAMDALVAWLIGCGWFDVVQVGNIAIVCFGEIGADQAQG